MINTKSAKRVPRNIEIIAKRNKERKITFKNSELIFEQSAPCIEASKPYSTNHKNSM